MMTASPPDITSEKVFSDLWERALELHPTVLDGEGEPYEVIFPGIRTHGPGPDFRGAVLTHRGRRVTGDVELHIEPSGWRGHGHHRDPAYNGVILQIVLTARGVAPDGRSPPTASVLFPHTPSASAPRGAELAPGRLATLGMQRFHEKSAGFRMQLSSGTTSDQLLYGSTLEALGYARNQRPFRQLADHVPIRIFSPLSQEPEASVRFAVLAALAVGAGLSDRLSTGEEAQARRVARTLGVRKRLSQQDWSGFRVRPGNAPVSRMRGGAALVAATLRPGLANALRLSFVSDGSRGLIQIVQRRPSIGQGLARTIVSNVFLPALYAWDSLDAGGIGDIVSEAFERMPAPPSDAVTRGVSRSLGLRPKIRTAAEHSGLHALARISSWPTGGAAA